MKNHTVILLSALLLCCSCIKQEAPVRSGFLTIGEIGVSGHSIVATKAIDSDFALEIIKAESLAQVKAYPAGSVPQRIALDPGEYRLIAHSTNENSWRQGNGQATYRDTSEVFTIIEDQITPLDMKVKLSNWRIQAQMPENFGTWFNAWSVEISQDERSVNISAGDNAWFDASSVKMKISVTNTDGDSFQSSVYTISNLKHGHSYTLKFSYVPKEEGYADINITIDDEWDDAGDEVIIIG